MEELRRLDPDDPRPEFICGDVDLDDFYQNDSKEGGAQLLSVTYVFLNADGKAVAFFSVSNDAIRREELTGSALKRVAKFVPHEKRYKSMPAAKIGRLGVCSDEQSNGLGTQVLDFLKVWFVEKNKTGCRFLVVDAYNNERTTGFYSKNDFLFVSPEDMGEDTRIMYFDLKRFRGG